MHDGADHLLFLALFGLFALFAFFVLFRRIRGRVVRGLRPLCDVRIAPELCAVAQRSGDVVEHEIAVLRLGARQRVVLPECEHADAAGKDGRLRVAVLFQLQAAHERLLPLLVLALEKGQIEIPLSHDRAMQFVPAVVRLQFIARKEDEAFLLFPPSFAVGARDVPCEQERILGDGGEDIHVAQKSEPGTQFVEPIDDRAVQLVADVSGDHAERDQPDEEHDAVVRRGEEGRNGFERIGTLEGETADRRIQRVQNFRGARRLVRLPCHKETDRRAEQERERDDQDVRQIPAVQHCPAQQKISPHEQGIGDQDAQGRRNVWRNCPKIHFSSLSERLTSPAREGSQSPAS